MNDVAKRMTGVEERESDTEAALSSGGFMGPVAVLTAIIFGSAVAIEFGLSGVWLVFWILRAESAQIESEISRLPIYCVLFLVLSVVAGAAFYSMVRVLWWRWRMQWAMWTMVAAIAAWFTWKT